MTICFGTTGRQVWRRLVWLGLAIMFMSAAVAWAEPRTLYKPRDIENARKNLERYAWAKSIVAGWKRNVAYAMGQDRAFFNELIPELTPGTFYGQNCPACVGKQSVTGESDLFQWNLEKPDQLVCKRCGTVYPNEKYPETGVLDCPSMGQKITYYQTPEELANPAERNRLALKWLGDRPAMTSFSSMIRYAKVHWAYSQVSTLAKLYVLTGDTAYAEHAVWILDRFAKVFPHYLYHSYDGSFADLPPAEVAVNMGKFGNGGRFPAGVIRHAYGLNQTATSSTLFNGFWGAGRLSVHGKGSDAAPLLELTLAYDLIHNAKYPDGRPLLDAQTDGRIRRDLIEAGCADLEQWDSLSNKGVAVFTVIAANGILFDHPERVHRAIDGLDRIMADRYHHDGFYSESPGYAAHNYDNMRELPDLLLGYSDPAGYQPKSGERVENMNPYKTGRVSLALQDMVRMLAPDNRMPIIGDTGYKHKLSPIYAEIMAARYGGQFAGLLETAQGAPLADKGSEYALWYRPADLKKPTGTVKLPLRSEWFPGWHVGVLRGGRETNDTALFINGNENRWTIKTNHRQSDVLSLSYYAFGRELASDRGYFTGGGQLTRDGRPGQDWTGGTLSHNVVVVDEKNQAKNPCGSNLELFGAAPGVEVIEASAYNAYPQCDVYRRSTALVRLPDGQNYAVDFFRARGGKVHQYVFHSTGKMTGFEPAQPAPQPVELAPVWSKWVEHPRALTTKEPRVFTWQSGGVNLDLRMLNSADLNRIVIADAPGWRQASPPVELDKPPIQQILVEHRAGGDGGKLATQYAAVIVPYKGEKSPVHGARLLQNDPARGVLAIEVRLADRTDVIVSTMDNERRKYGPVSVAGRFGFVSLNGQGRATQAYLLGGTGLKCGDLKIELPAATESLKVRSVHDRTIRLAQPLSAAVAGAATLVLARGPKPLASAAGVPMPQTGFDIESAAGETITVRDYPALPSDTVTVLCSKWISE